MKLLGKKHATRGSAFVRNIFLKLVVSDPYNRFPLGGSFGVLLLRSFLGVLFLLAGSLETAG